MIVKRIERRLEPVLLKFTAAAAAREHDETRRWLNDYGIPKAVRVAHREGHVALKRLGVSDLAAVRARTELAVGAEVPQAQSTIDKTHDGTQKMNAAEAAEVCAMMFEVHGRAVDDLLGELVSTGCLPDPDEAAKARTTTLELLAGRESRCSGT